MTRWLMFVPPLLFAALAVLFWVGMHRADPDALPSAIVGQAAPAVEVAALATEPLLTDDALRAPGVKLVNFWASWCAPCRAEHPVLMELSDGGIAVFGVNYKDAPDKAAAFLAELGNPYSLIGTDESGRMSLNWGLYGVPETFVIDGAGKVVLRYAGPITRSVLEETIRPAIAVASGQ